MMIFLKNRWVLLCVSGLIIFGCKKKDEEVPYVPVDFTIAVANYPNLNAVNGWEYFSAGSRGLIVYRYSLDQFNAFDRHCPYKPKEECAKVNVDTSGITATDTCCGSQFQLTDGNVLSGPANKALVVYSTSYDGIRLRIYN